MGAPSTAFSKQFTDTFTLLSQQMESRIQPTVLVDSNWKGEQKLYNQYSTDDMVEIMTEFADTPVQSGNHLRRMVSPRYFVSNTLEDPQDALAMLGDPKSTYMQAKLASANRTKDDILISALGATAYIGKSGTDIQALTLTIVSSSAGLTKTKLLSAKTKLDEGEIPNEDRTMLVKASQIADVLNSTEAASGDFNVVRALVEGSINTWLGFNWVRSERLTANGSSETLCYAYQRTCVQLAIQKDITGRVDERSDKNYAWQVYVKMCMGATRLDEAGVVQIACTETF